MESISFEQRIAERFSELSPAEQRAIRFFQSHREEILITSAADLAAQAKTSDATIIRAAKGLGYAGLDALRRALASELKNSLSPAERLNRTLIGTGDSAAAAFDMSLETHLQCLQSLRRNITPVQFEAAVEAVAAARRVVAFGLGPTSAIANYLIIQLNRFGLEALSLTNTGLLFADDLGKLRKGDLVLIFAYGRVYAELVSLIDAAENSGLRAILITDTLASALRRRVELVLTVPRGRADMLSMHTATLGFIEAMLVGVAAKRPTETLASLRRLNDSRKKLAGKTSRLALH